MMRHDQIADYKMADHQPRAVARQLFTKVVPYRTRPGDLLLVRTGTVRSHMSGAAMAWSCRAGVHCSYE